jgi:hypothetical protein
MTARVFERVFHGFLAGLGSLLLLTASVGFGRAFLASRDASEAEGSFAAYATVTVLVGLVGLAFAYRGWEFFRRLRVLRQREERFVDTPWRVRDDWSRGEVRYSSRSRKVNAWYLALALTLPGLLMPIVWMTEGGDGDWRGAVLAVVLPVAALAAWIHAVRSSLRWRRFRTSVLRISSLPGRVGDRFEGTLETRFTDPPEAGVALTMSCLRCMRELRWWGAYQGVVELYEPLWEETREVGREELARGSSGTSVPVSFAIPADCPPTSTRDPDDRVAWRLRAHATVAQLKFEALFEVPVY